MSSQPFKAKWQRTRCLACGLPWDVGDLVAYNNDEEVVHAGCVGVATPSVRKETVCKVCFLTSCDHTQEERDNGTA